MSLKNDVFIGATVTKKDGTVLKYGSDGNIIETIPPDKKKDAKDQG